MRLEMTDPPTGDRKKALPLSRAREGWIYSGLAFVQDEVIAFAVLGERHLADGSIFDFAVIIEFHPARLVVLDCSRQVVDAEKQPAAATPLLVVGLVEPECGVVAKREFAAVGAVILSHRAAHRILPEFLCAIDILDEIYGCV